MESSSNDKPITEDKVTDSEKVDDDNRFSKNWKGISPSSHKEAACLKLITFYVLPVLYTLFMIVYFTLLRSFYYM